MLKPSEAQKETALVEMKTWLHAVDLRFAEFQTTFPFSGLMSNRPHYPGIIRHSWQRGSAL